ncbi:CWF19-like protein 2 [Lamellibrachia satsuma]|nr:CWF19-like protein 2 [Lamellibrachia satsuma]
MVIECVPMPREIGDGRAPIYFKKALLESDKEWTENKKVVDLSQKDIRRAVPKGFPYFAVDFGLQGGFAHVIEDETHFPHYFGRVCFPASVINWFTQIILF